MTFGALAHILASSVTFFPSSTILFTLNQLPFLVPSTSKLSLKCIPNSPYSDISVLCHFSIVQFEMILVLPVSNLLQLENIILKSILKIKYTVFSSHKLFPVFLACTINHILYPTSVAKWFHSTIPPSSCSCLCLHLHWCL